MKACPSCGYELYDLAQRCNNCGLCGLTPNSLPEKVKVKIKTKPKKKKIREVISCIYCGGLHTYKNGSNRAYCRDCKTTFNNGSTNLKGMKWDKDVINMFIQLRGSEKMLSLSQIRNEIKRIFSRCPSSSTLSNWDYRYEVDHHDVIVHTRLPDIMIDDLAAEHIGFVGNAKQVLNLLGYSTSTKITDTQAYQQGYIVKKNNSWAIRAT